MKTCLSDAATAFVGILVVIMLTTIIIVIIATDEIIGETDERIIIE